jgi:hypothetical protein
VQKTREKQQAARRAHGRARTQSPNSQEGLSSVFENSLGKNAGESPILLDSNPIGIHRQANQARHGSFQMEIPIIAGPHPYVSGPQSYSEVGPSSVILGSFTELDFAYALQRPGVVPMGESVTSSIDMSSGPVAGYGQSPFHPVQHHQSSIVGSYGSNLVSQAGNQKRRIAAGAVPLTSRSYGEGDVVSAALEATLHQQPPNVSIMSSPDSRMGAGADTGDLAAGNIVNPSRAVVGNPASGSLATQPPSTDDMSLQSSLLLGGGNFQNYNFPMYGNAQAYLQQQHAALQQQQLILQQQQAALVLQQEQLRAYGINQAYMNANTTNVPSISAAGMNPPNFTFVGAAPGMMPTGGATTPGAFYYVQGVDGTPILVGANPNSMGGGQIPSGHISGMTTGMVRQQIPGMQAMPSMPPPASAGIMVGQGPSGLPITGMQPGSVMPSPGMHGVLPGMMVAPPPPGIVRPDHLASDPSRPYHPNTGQASSPQQQQLHQQSRHA